MSSVYFLIGKVLGKYKVLEHLGHGGMSEVYKGQQLQLHRLVAIKVLHPFLADDEGFVVRFQREARIIATLRHPNIVQVFDFDYNKELDLYYMVMEYINGPTLKTRLEQESLSLEHIASIGAAIADALDYAHERGMIHRDIKPANIMFLDEDQPVLTDFGIAKMLTLSGLTASGAMVGTPAYMAPEVGTGKAGTSYSDIYALGVVLYQAITGSLPFNSESPMGIVMQHINDPSPHPSLLVPTMPSALEAVILKAMEKEPAARYNRAREMATALRQAMGLENANGPITPVPIYKIPSKTVAVPTPEDSEGRPPSPTSPPPARVTPSDMIKAATGPTRSISLDGSPSSEKQIKPVKKILRGGLLILVFMIVGGALWFGMTGRLPPVLRIFQARGPQQTASIVTPIPGPTHTPPPAISPSPTASPNPNGTPVPTGTRVPTLTATPMPEPCNPRGRVDKVEIEPNEVVGPGSSLIAYISMRNTGDCAWQVGTELQHESGELLEAPQVIPLKALLPDDTIQLHMPLNAPQAFGTYTSIWQVRQPDDTALGSQVKINIAVEDMPTATPLPLPAVVTSEITPSPLALAPPELTTWKNVEDRYLWQGTVLLQATGGTGSYRFYNGGVREENYIVEGEYTQTARRCDPLPLDIWIISGVESLHWQADLPYPEADMCN